MSRRGWTGYGDGDPDSSEGTEQRAKAVPDFAGQTGASVRKLVNELLAGTVEPRWLAEWWETEIFPDQTPELMLAGGRYRQLWLLAGLFASEDGGDTTEIEHMQE